MGDLEVEKKGFTKGYVILCVLYAFLLTLSNVMTGKVISVCGITLTAGILVFPAVYIISDLMTEVYGIRLSMLSIRLNTLCALIFAIMSLVLVALPYPVFWQGQEAYKTVFLTTPRIIVASLIGYYFGDWLNSSIISWLKVKQGGKGFAARAIWSTVFGELADTGLFFMLAFIGTMPLRVLVGIIVAQYCAKVGYEAICVPITARIVKFWKAWDAMDIYDTGEIGQYNPFRMNA